MRHAKRISLVGLALALSILLLGPWIKHHPAFRSWVANELPVTTAGRWWRCRGVVRPRISRASKPWMLVYAWERGYGPGEVRLEIESSGRAVLSAKSYDDDSTHVKERILARHVVRQLATLVDRSSIFCQSAVARKGYKVYDIGRLSVEVAVGDAKKHVYIDECHTLPDPEAFYKVVDYIQGLKAQVGEELEWGPYGLAYVPETCNK